MPQNDSHRAKVRVQCRCGGQHDLCLLLERGVPPEVRCGPEEPAGFGYGGGGGCTLNVADLAARAARELRDNTQEARRRHYVLVQTP